MEYTQDQMGSDSVKPFPLQSVEELFATPDEECSYIVENLLPSSGLSILAGKPKAGKSTLCRQLAVCVAKGEDFLCRKTRQGLVVYVALEEKRAEIKAHFKELGLRAGDTVQTYCAPPRKDALAMLEENLKAAPDVRLVILDPIFKFIKVSDSNDYVKVNDAFEPLLNLARKYAVHIMTVHHMKKRKADDVMDNNLGSTAIVGAVDTFIALQRNEKTAVRTLCSRQRYGRDMEETQLDWDAGSRRLALGMTKEEADGQAAIRTEDRITSDLIEYLRDHPGCTQEAIFQAVTGRANTKKRIFRKFVDDRLFLLAGTGAKGDPYTYTLVNRNKEEKTVVP